MRRYLAGEICLTETDRRHRNKKRRPWRALPDCHRYIFAIRHRRGRAEELQRFIKSKDADCLIKLLNRLPLIRLSLFLLGQARYFNLTDADRGQSKDYPRSYFAGHGPAVIRITDD